MIVAEARAAISDAIAEASARDRPTVAAATVEVEPLDPSAVVLASRRATDRWFCWEQPERGGFALAALGSAREIVSRGPERVADVAADAAELFRDAVATAPADAPPGAGPVLTGGFAFAPDGGGSPAWSSLPPALMVLPELALHRSGGRSFLTLSALVEPGGGAEASERVRRRAEGLVEASLGPLDPLPGGKPAISAPLPPRHYEEAVAAAVARIAAGELEKVVLAREVVVESARAHDPAPVLAALRELFPSCFCFCVGTPEAAFTGASPELLIRRSGAVAGTVALAGSTRRSADPAVDDHLGEQMLRSAKVREEHEIVANRIARLLRPHAVWVQSEDDPAVVRIANIQHLATPIRAHLADARSAIELAGLLHPTPAVGGEPREPAVELIAELEGMDRGWYAGPVGWTDAAEDGEFCVALRSALLRDRRAHLYAGCGIVAGSDPAAELDEAEIKLEALLPLLAG